MASAPPASELHAEAGLDELLKGSREQRQPDYADVSLGIGERRSAFQPVKDEVVQPEAVGLMGALPPSMRNVVAGSTCATRVLGSAKSLGIFFGFEEEKPFTIPDTRQEFFRRVRSNAFLFRSNYLTLFLLASLYSVIKEPLYFLCLISICMIYISITRLYDSGDAITINHRRVPRGKATGCVLVLSILLAGFLIPMMIFWAASVGGILCATHIVFRNYNAQSSSEMDLSKHNV